MKAGKDFHLAYSPEREDPGNPDSKVAIIPKVIGGLTPACLEKAQEIYGTAIKTLVPVSSCRAAEATKLLENIFRSVNIALVNELAQLCERLDIDVWEVVDAASTKPFGFMRFDPGPGHQAGFVFNARRLPERLVATRSCPSPLSSVLCEWMQMLNLIGHALS